MGDLDPLVASYMEFETTYVSEIVGNRVSLTFAAFDATGQPYRGPLTDWIAEVHGANGQLKFEGQLDSQGLGSVSYVGSSVGADVVTVRMPGAAHDTDVRYSAGQGPDVDDGPATTVDDPDCGVPCSRSENNLQLLLLAPNAHCPVPSGSSVTNCIDQAAPFSDGDQDGLPNGNIRRGVSVSEWKTDADVDFYGCNNDRNRCQNYRYDCGDTDGCQTNPGYEQRVSDATQRVQRNQIFPGAIKRCPPASSPLHNACNGSNRKGDVGITQAFRAGPSEWYRAIIEARLSNVEDNAPNDRDEGFKARLTVAPRGSGGGQIRECNAVLGDRFDRAHPGLLVKMPSGTASVVVEFRAHISNANRSPGESPRSSSGVANLYHIVFRQVPEPDPDRADDAVNGCAADRGFR